MDSLTIQNRVGRIQKTRTKQRGIAMIELTFALIGLAILAGGVYYAFQQNTRKTEIKEAVSTVTSIAGELRSKFGSTNLYGTVTTAIAVQSRSIPERFRNVGTNTASNMWGGLITVTPVTLTAANDAVSLSFANVPQDECVDIVVGTQNTGRRISVGGTVVRPTDGVLNLATLATQCESAARVAIVWDVGRTGA